MPIVASFLLVFCLAAQQQSNRQSPNESKKQPEAEQKKEDKLQPSSPPAIAQAHSDSTSNKKQDQSNRQETSKEPHDWVDKINAMSTVVIAAFTVAMFFVVKTQMREYRTRERAWVTFLVPEKPIVQEMKGGQPAGFLVIGFIENVGSTPATVSKKFHFGSIEPKGKDLQSIPPYLQIKEEQGEYQMIPKATEPAIAKVSDAEMQGIRQGSLTLYILGQVVYTDAFRRPHETRYCLRYYPQPTTGRQSGFYPEGPSAYLKAT
jgi:hypothetical protein